MMQARFIRELRMAYNWATHAAAHGAWSARKPSPRPIPQKTRSSPKLSEKAPLRFESVGVGLLRQCDDGQALRSHWPRNHIRPGRTDENLTNVRQTYCHCRDVPSTTANGPARSAAGGPFAYKAPPVGRAKIVTPARLRTARPPTAVVRMAPRVSDTVEAPRKPPAVRGRPRRHGWRQGRSNPSPSPQARMLG